MRRLWERMTAIYGHKFTSAYGILPEDEGGVATLAGDTWARGLVGISEMQIAAGLEACIKHYTPNDWPELPNFRQKCLGIPSLAALRHDLRSPVAERTPFTRLAWSFIDGHRFRHADPVELTRILKDAYELAADAVLRGEPLPQVSGILEAPAGDRKKASSESVEKYLNWFQSFFGGKNGPTPADEASKS